MRKEYEVSVLVTAHVVAGTHERAQRLAEEFCEKIGSVQLEGLSSDDIIGPDGAVLSSVYIGDDQ